LLGLKYFNYPFKDKIIPNLLDFVSPEGLKRYSLMLMLMIRRKKSCI